MPDANQSHASGLAERRVSIQRDMLARDCGPPASDVLMRPRESSWVRYWLTVAISNLVVASAVAGVGLCGGAEPSQPASAQSNAASLEGPLTPAQAMNSIVLLEGLRIELVASDPTVESPVAMTFDERGRMFVAENRGYPTGPGAGQPPAGRIAMLEDFDGNGHYEKRTTFADGLTFPNGVMPWQGGLIVTCAPDILYLKDTDGDGRADQRSVWFTGFSSEGSTQLRVSHPTLSIDGWIYVSSGLTGGAVTCPARPQRPPLKFGRTDFRFRPDCSEYETCDGGSQFGLSFDDFGRRFICHNRVQVQHVVLSSRYLRRNPHLAFSQTVQDCPADLTPEPLKGHGQAARLFPISANVTTADSHAGTFTAACGVLVWRGDSLPEQYRGGVFSCDPTGNLVHFDTLVQDGATFAARPARSGREFLASRDNWFRPVFLALGPDDALYVCDMYRKTIEHPDYLPEEIRKRTDFESGKGLGRIWRVVNDKWAADELAKRRSASRVIGHTSAATGLLLASSGFRRDLGYRLLLENPQRERIALRQLTDDPTQRARLTPAATARVLRLLEARGELDDDVIRRFLAHQSAGVREQALILAGPRLAKSRRLVDAVVPLADDPDPRLRFQWALSAGEIDDSRAARRLARLALHDGGDRWMRAAILSSIAGRENVFLSELLAHRTAGNKDAAALHADVGRLLGASRPEAEWLALLKQMVSADVDSGRRIALVTGFLEALRRRGAVSDGGLDLAGGARPDDPDSQLVRLKLTELFDEANRTARDSSSDSSRRTAAIGLLAQTDFKTAGKTLLELVDPRQPADVQSAAIRALGGMSDRSIASTLLDAERFAAYPPGLREEVLSAMLARQDHLQGLLVSLESGAVPAGAIDSLRRTQLTRHKDAAIRARAETVFGAAQSSDRGKVYEDFKSILALRPDPETGRDVFKKHCANCHRLDREGFAVGPDLFGIRNQPKESILLHVLVPEQEITKGFAAYVVETKDGRTLTGLIASETPESVTLRQALGKEDTVLRGDIERLAASGLSLMPQEMEKAMSRQELADVISYVKGEATTTHSHK